MERQGHLCAAACVPLHLCLLPPAPVLLQEGKAGMKGLGKVQEWGQCWHPCMASWGQVRLHGWLLSSEPAPCAKLRGKVELQGLLLLPCV